MCAVQISMLTRKQKQVLDTIIEHIREKGYAPSVRELAKRLKLSSSATVWQHVNALRKKGYLQGGKQAHSLKLKKGPVSLAEEIMVPVLGLVQAGSPIEVYPDQSEALMVPKELVFDVGRELFALEVKGDSMKDDGILEGDYIICEKNSLPQNGQVVVAIVNNSEATIKRFYKERNFIRLMPANASHKPILARNVQVQGVVRALIRRY